MPSAMLGELGLAACAGAGLGIGSSAPIGPINLWIAEQVLRHEERRIPWYVAGVVTADAALALLALWGFHAVLDATGAVSWLEISSGIFLVILGLLGLARCLSKRQPQAAQTLSRLSAHRPIQHYLLGLLMCGANPAFLVFWVFGAGVLESYEILPGSLAAEATFAAGVMLGDTLWFLALVHLSRRGRQAATPELLRNIRTVIAATFVAVGGAAIYKGM